MLCVLPLCAGQSSIAGMPSYYHTDLALHNGSLDASAVTFPVDSACSKRSYNLGVFSNARSTPDAKRSRARPSNASDAVERGSRRDVLRGELRPELAGAVSQILHATMEDELATLLTARPYERSLDRAGSQRPLLALARDRDRRHRARGPTRTRHRLSTVISRMGGPPH
jgi:hypothetical protein